MIVAVFVGPLGNVPDEVEHAERAGALWVRVYVGKRAARVAMIGSRNVRGIPFTAPGIDARVGGLRGVLPLPFMRKAFPGPGGVGTRVFEGNPGDRFVVPARGEIAVRPVAQKIVIIGGMVVRGVEELLELRVGDGRAVKVISVQMQTMQVRTARRILPGVLHVDSGIVAAFDFNAPHGKIKIALGNFDHAGRRRIGGFSRRNFDDGLRNRGPGAWIIAQRFARTLGHEGKKFAEGMT